MARVDRSFNSAQDDKAACARQGCQRMDKEKRNGKGSECVFVSMSVFPFLFRRKDEPKSSNATLFLQQEDQEGEASAAIARHSEPVISPAAKARADTRVGTKVQQILPLASLGQDDTVPAPAVDDGETGPSAALRTTIKGADGSADAHHDNGALRTTGCRSG